MTHYQNLPILSSIQQKNQLDAGISTDNQTGRLKIVVEELVNSRYPNIDYLEEPTTPRMARGVYGNVTW